METITNGVKNMFNFVLVKIEHIRKINTEVEILARQTYLKSADLENQLADLYIGLNDLNEKLKIEGYKINFPVKREITAKRE